MKSLAMAFVLMCGSAFALLQARWPTNCRLAAWGQATQIALVDQAESQRPLHPHGPEWASSPVLSFPRIWCPFCKANLSISNTRRNCFAAKGITWQAVSYELSPGSG